MRHKLAHRKLNRTASHRKAMFANMASSLIEHEQTPQWPSSNLLTAMRAQKAPLTTPKKSLKTLERRNQSGGLITVKAEIAGRFRW